MAPIKQPDLKKKKRTFFKSRLDIQLPIVKDDNIAKKQEKGKVIVPIKKSKEVTKVLRSNKPEVNTRTGKTTGVEKKKDSDYKKVKVYTSKAKSKAQAIVGRSTRSIARSSKNSAIGMDNKPIRMVSVSSRITKSLTKIPKAKATPNDMDKDKDKKKNVIETTRSVKGKKEAIPKTKTGSKVVNTTRSKSFTLSKTIVQKKKHKVVTAKSIKATKEILSKRILSTYKSKSQQSQRHQKPEIDSESTVKSSISSGGGGSSSSSSSKPLKKEYMTAGFYCQDPHPPSTRQLHNKILSIRKTESKNTKNQSKSKKIDIPVGRSTRSKQASSSSTTTTTTTTKKTNASASKDEQKVSVSFPPLPYDHGYDLFFNQEHEFTLPYNIMKEKLDGKLDGKKKPMAYSKISKNIYPERQKYQTDFHAICKCSPESKCSDQCINRLMSYLCGKDCPAGDECTNKTLRKRKAASYKVVYTGSRGFGIVLTQDVKEGDFVMDYRGEVITIDTFMERIQNEYKGTKNFYALAYDQDEVIDAGMKGNDARFINHGCAPNLEVRKFEIAGDGLEEYEVGMWALRDIKAGEELFYDYNFESFGVAAQSDELRTKCHCGAPNCIGFLGRKAGEKTAKGLAAELANKAKTLTIKKSTKKTSKIRKNTSMNMTLQGGTAVMGLMEDTPSIISDSGPVSSQSSVTLKTPSESSVDVVIGPVTSSTASVSVDSSSMTNRKKRKSEVSTLDVDSSIIAKKKNRKSEPAPVPSITAKKAKPRRSEPIPALEASPLNMSISPTQTKTKKYKPRKSEPIFPSQGKTLNPRISMAEVREAARIKKAEIVKARRGVPKGWVILPLGTSTSTSVASNAGSGGMGGRRPPRDRSSLG
ncbi:hypothetical protein V865_006202 [Kwoniella europaea PYCC6329]|uniref:Histone-lysine N-methyltransferase ASH1L n=1 Tax=Kwoniella europaea PYCC6329 TaxID=1423913 RepID=A0AAX4KNS8_9TREE